MYICILNKYMQYNDYLPIKYITETHRIFKDYPCDLIDVVFDLSKEIIKTRKSKKNWTSKDFIFDETLFYSLFKERSDELLQSLILQQYVVKNEDDLLYSITESGINLVYNF